MSDTPQNRIREALSELMTPAERDAVVELDAMVNNWPTPPAPFVLDSAWLRFQQARQGSE